MIVFDFCTFERIIEPRYYSHDVFEQICLVFEEQIKIYIIEFLKNDDKLIVIIVTHRGFMSSVIYLM